MHRSKIIQTVLVLLFLFAFLIISGETMMLIDKFTAIFDFCARLFIVSIIENRNAWRKWQLIVDSLFDLWAKKKDIEVHSGQTNRDQPNQWHHLSVIPAWDPNYPVVDWGPAPCVLNLQKTIFFSNAHSWHGTATGDDDGHYNISQNICFERGALAGRLAESNQYSEWSRSIQVPAKLTTSSVTLTLKCVSAGDRNSHRSNAVNSNGNALKMRRAWRFRSQACLLLLTHEK